MTHYLTSIKISLPLAEPCETVGGPSSGVPCIFPFKFEGITYETCEEYFGQIVCATEIDGDGNAINYGICGPNCPQTFTTNPTTILSTMSPTITANPTTTAPTKGKLSSFSSTLYQPWGFPLY